MREAAPRPIRGNDILEWAAHVTRLLNFPENASAAPSRNDRARRRRPRPFEVRHDPVYNDSGPFIIYLPGESSVSTDVGYCLTVGGEPVKINGESPLGQAYGPSEAGYVPLENWFQLPVPPSGAESFALNLAVYSPDSGSGDMKACLYWGSEPPAVSNYSVFAAARIAEVEQKGSASAPFYDIRQLVVGAICLNAPASGEGTPLYPLNGLHLVTGFEYPEDPNDPNAYKIVAHRVQLTVANNTLVVAVAQDQVVDTVAHDSVYPNS